MNWVRSGSWAGYTVTTRVPYNLQTTVHFIPRLNYTTQVLFHTVSVGRWIVEDGKETK